MQNNTLTFKKRKLKPLELLGQGNFGTVWKVQDEKTNEILALKMQHQIQQNELDIIELLSKFSHRNIVNILGYEKINDQCHGILMECCEQNLYERLQNKVYEQKDLRYILVSIADGLKVLHLNNIIHRDLKPENIMIKTISDVQNPKNTQTLYKIADFGLSTNKSINLTYQVGTCYYMAPELINNQEYTSLVDVWSLGAIMYELVTNKPLFDGISQNEILWQIANFDKKEVQDNFRKKIEIINQDEYQNLIKKMLQPNPCNRIDIEGVLRILRNKYSSPPKVLPLFQPSIQDRTKLNKVMTFRDDQNNKQNFQKLLGPPKFLTPQTQNQEQKNDPNKLQQNQMNKEQKIANQQPTTSQIINSNNQTQSTFSKIQNGSPRFNQNNQQNTKGVFPIQQQNTINNPTFNFNGVNNEQNNQSNIIGVIPNQESKILGSPRINQRANNFNLQELKFQK